jgi:hypothetical protein
MEGVGRTCATTQQGFLCGYALAAAFRRLQISRSTLVTVNVTGPRIRPEGPRTISPPTMETNATMECIFNRRPTNFHES